MNPSTLRILENWCTVNKKKLHVIKKIYLGVELKDRPDVLKQIEKDTNKKLALRQAEEMEKAINKKHLCNRCTTKSSFPICLSDHFKTVKNNQGKKLIMQCRNFNDKRPKNKTGESPKV